MKIDKLFDNTTDGLSKMLELTWQRNQSIAGNIANAETPQYRATDVNFAHELEKAFKVSQESVAKTNTKHLDLTTQQSAHLVPDYSGVTKPDGNNVDIDLQMGKLTYNSGKYSTAANLLRKKFAMISNALRSV